VSKDLGLQPRGNGMFPSRRDVSLIQHPAPSWRLIFEGDLNGGIQLFPDAANRFQVMHWLEEVALRLGDTFCLGLER
jgi:hypothetical protein